MPAVIALDKLVRGYREVFLVEWVYASSGGVRVIAGFDLLAEYVESPAKFAYPLVDEQFWGYD